MKDYILKHLWLVFTFITVVAWGFWGALIEHSNLPPTIGYIIWAITMIPCAIVAMTINKWKFDFRSKSILWGSLAGLTGAGGQLILFQALREGPAFLIFPIVSLYPVLTVFLALAFLNERATRPQSAGIIVALVAIVLLSTSSGSLAGVKTYDWLLLSIGVFLMWGLQGYALKFANLNMKAEDVFFYMTLTAVIAIPFAYYMTDFSTQSEWTWNDTILTFLIQILNSIGALTLVYAIRYGKVIIVVPLSAFAPAITILISLLIYKVVPNEILIIGMILSIIATYMLSKE